MPEKEKNKAGGKKKDHRITVLIVLLVLSAVSFIWFDIPVSRDVYENGTDHTLTNPWAGGFKQLGNTWVQLWLLLVWTWLCRKPKAFVTAALALILAGAAVWTLKLTVQRPRPRETMGVRTEKLINQTSFPSGDTASSFAAAGAIGAFLHPGISGLVYVCAAGVGCLRIGSLAHYPSDVFAGALIGLACGWWARRLRGKIFKWNFDLMRETTWQIWPVVGFLVLGFLPGLVEDENYIFIFLKKYWFAVVVMMIYYQIRYLKERKSGDSQVSVSSGPS